MNTEKFLRWVKKKIEIHTEAINLLHDVILLLPTHMSEEYRVKYNDIRERLLEEE